MRSLTEYISSQIFEGEDEDKEKTTRRGQIKFTIWEEPDKKVTWLDDNEKYQKIEYKLEDKDKGLSIDFLLGFQEGSWKLWIGKIGSCSYDDDPYCSFDTDKFSEGIVSSCKKSKMILTTTCNITLRQSSMLWRILH